MKTSYLFILISFLISSCKHEDGNKKPVIPNNEVQFQVFSYGNREALEESLNWESSVDRVVSFSPALKLSSEKTCLSSHAKELEKNEWGPKLFFCSKMTENGQTLLRDSIHALLNQNEVHSFPEGEIEFSNKKAQSRFLSLNEIEALPLDASPDFAFIGDKRLAKKLDYIYSESENLYSLHTVRERKIQSSFSGNYFSILPTNTSVIVIFPSPNLDLSSVSVKYWVLEFNKDPDWDKEFTRAKELITSLNATALQNCKMQNIEITEVMTDGNSRYKKYIEMRTKEGEDFLCGGDLTIQIENVKEKISLGTFLFPGEIILLTEESSAMGGIQLPASFWKQFKKGKTVSVSNRSGSTNYEVGQNIRTSWGEDFFSIKGSGLNSNCHAVKLYKTANWICADPGIEGVDDASVNFCKAEDFILTELHPYGIYDGVRRDIYSKYIELLYRGNSACKTGNLQLKIDEHEVPIASVWNEIQPAEIFIVGNLKNYSDYNKIIRRNLEFLSPNSQILIQSHNSTRSLYVREEDAVFVPVDHLGRLHSMMISGGKIYHHPEGRAVRLRGDLRDMNLASPGEVFEPGSSSDPRISEVNLFGTKRNSSIYTTEKFIEWEWSGKGTLKLGLEGGTERRVYLVPSFFSGSLGHLAKKGGNCLGSIQGIYDEDIIFPEGLKRIRISNPVTASEDTIEINSIFTKSDYLKGTTYYSAGIRRETGSPILHRSVSLTGEGECYPHSINSPSLPNILESAIGFLPTVDEGILRFSYSGHFDFPHTVPIRIFSPEPIYENMQSVATQNSIESIHLQEFNLDVSAFNKKSSYYFEDQTAKGQILWNPSGVFIKAIHPNPTNPQNEWVLLCNESEVSVNINTLILEDESSSDAITSYSTRKGVNLPVGLDQTQFSGNTSSLNKKQCAYILDPDHSGQGLVPIGNTPTIIATITKTDSIGNGLGVSEKLDLYMNIAGTNHFLHSYGNRHSANPFTITLGTDETAVLISGKSGGTVLDYEVKKWE